jgi:hypothetical protein
MPKKSIRSLANSLRKYVSNLLEDALFLTSNQQRTRFDVKYFTWMRTKETEEASKKNSIKTLETQTKYIAKLESTGKELQQQVVRAKR